MDALHLYHELEQLLRMNSRYCMDDGTLLKNRIVEDALSLNPLLVKLLLGNDKIKAVFFQDVEGVVVFDKVSFNASFPTPNSWVAATPCSRTRLD